MVGRGRGRGGRGNQGQQEELAELRHMIEDLSRVVFTLQRQEPMGARMEIPEGNHDPTDIPEGGLEDDSENGEEENPFHNAEPANQWAQRGLEEQLIRALDLNGGGIRIEVADFFGKLHAEDYLD